jgi:excisionase family DNA binding protein
VSVLDALLPPDLRAELYALIDARIAAVLAAREPERKRWLSIKECAEHLGCSERAVYMRVRRGRIPAAAIRHQGRSVLVDRLALDRALERT